ncbi:MAG: hypothetical protein JO346_10670 [Alphaproteobacteria bacterium]|nr:hypothetical protein [Alphaproteobacteria bacterium]
MFQLAPPVALPLWLILVHIFAGSTAILAGFAAALSKKGDPFHRLSGKVFVAAMFVMATAAIILSTMLTKQGMGNLSAGAFVLALIGSAWLTARRGDNPVGWPEYALLLFSIACFAVELVFTALAVRGGRHGFDGYLWEMYAAFATLIGLAIAMDIKVIRRGAITGAARIRRHIWRMCTAFFIASGSFFLGQQKVMPVWMKGSPLLFVFALAPLAILLVYMLITREKRARRAPAAPLAAE